MKPQVVTANRLSDGVVVYLAGDGGWTNRIEDSWVSDTEADNDAVMQLAATAVANRQVIDPYLIEVKVTDAAVVPVSYREVIRATGPSVRPDLCRTVTGIERSSP